MIMALLTSCWFIIESIVIPDGFRKWFYLSFYIRPIFLFFTQIFLWFNQLQRFLLFVFFFPFRIIYFLVLFIVKLFKMSVLFSRGPTIIEEIPQAGEQKQDVFLSFSSIWGATYVFTVYEYQPKDCSVKTSDFEGVEFLDAVEFFEEVVENQNQGLWLLEFLSSDHHINALSACYEDQSGTLSSSSSSLTGSSTGAELDVNVKDSILPPNMFSPNQEINSAGSNRQEENWFHQDSDFELESFKINSPDLSPLRLNNMLRIYPDLNLDMNTCCLSTKADESSMNSPSISGSDSVVVTLPGQEAINRSTEEQADEFYNKYAERMRWFDVLNHERQFGLNKVLHKFSTTSFPSSDMGRVDLSLEYMARNKIAQRRLIRSLESDLELVYVAQTCSSWEALHHQYQKVEALADSTPQNVVFHRNVPEEFQKFQILLERFVEDEKTYEGKRYSRYISRRFSFKSFLQVPQVTGYVKEGSEETEGEFTGVAEVLQAIDKCIKAFWVYVKSENKKSPCTFKSFLLIYYPPVEDPRDSHLLHHLTTILKQKKTLLKNLTRGDQKCWPRKVKCLQTNLSPDEDLHLLSAMIDMMLVERVLKMSIISASHLK